MFISASLVVALVVGAPIAVAGLGRSSLADSAQHQVNANGAVVWDVDESTKEIKVTVRLAFSSATVKVVPPSNLDKEIANAKCMLFQKCATPQPQKVFERPPRTQVQEELIQRAIERVEQSIMAAWDGQLFGCYQLRVKLVTRYVQDPAAVGADEIHVTLDDAVVTVLQGDRMRIKYRYDAFVSTVRGEQDYLSDEPTDRDDPKTGPEGASTWPLAGKPDNYQHEFGHILGLDDNYDATTGALRPNAISDLMYDQAQFGLSSQSVARAVRRSGLNIDALSCAYRYQLPPSRHFPWALDNKIAMDVVLCDFPFPYADPRVRNRVTSGSYSGSLQGSVEVPKISSGRGGGPVSGSYTVVQRSPDSLSVDVFFDPALSIHQEARFQNGELVVAGQPSFSSPGADALDIALAMILGPEPWFLRLYSQPAECP